jgi:hypothetical protein
MGPNAGELAITLRRRQVIVLTSLMLITAALTAGGCTTRGPAAIRVQRAQYSAAVQQTTDEQLLQNLVRLRYGQTPTFLELTGIVVQLNVETGGDARVDFGSNTTAGVGISRIISEQPTVTYLPSQGEAYVRRFLTPVTPQTLLLLWDSGWSYTRVTRLCIQRMNGLENVPRASGPTPSVVDGDPNFERALNLVAPLVRDGRLRFELEQAPAGNATAPPVVMLRLAPGSVDDPAVVEALKSLRLAVGRDHYPVVHGVPHEAGPPWAALYVQTRSLLGTLFFVANAIEVPESDRRAGIVATALTSAGAPVDWAAITNSILRIRVSESRPDGALLSVRNHDRWFFIEDRDFRSKSTFVLLSQIYALQAAPPTGILPTLTLPVGRN